MQFAVALLLLTGRSRQLRPSSMHPPSLSLPVLFRDNLAEVLAGAVPGERQMEAKFKQWLQRCHATLDKSVRFEALADARTQVGLAGVRDAAGQRMLFWRHPAASQLTWKWSTWHATLKCALKGAVRLFKTLSPSSSLAPLQAAVRSKHGEATTAFERVTDGSRTAAAGDVVRINAKPQLVGRVLFFTIPQVGCLWL